MLVVESVSTLFFTLKFSGTFFNFIIDMFKCDVLKPRIRNLGNLCLWKPESEKSLLVKSGIQEIFACGINNPVLLQSVIQLQAFGIQLYIVECRIQDHMGENMLSRYRTCVLLRFSCCASYL